MDNSGESTGYTGNQYACEDTQDKVYLLSYKDICNEDYGFTDTASRIAYDAAGKANWYWLRSPSWRGDSLAYHVDDYDGSIYNYGVNTSFGVRPALTRKLD